MPEAQDSYDRRFSFCCSVCRKRCTSMSVRFLGRRVYLGLAVVLVWGRGGGGGPAGGGGGGGPPRPAGPTPAAARLGAGLGVPIRTLERWRRWWQTEFVLTPLWQAQCARFMPPVAAVQLPGDLLERFAGEAHETLMRLLYFLTPLTVRSLIVVGEGR